MKYFNSKFCDISCPLIILFTFYQPYLKRISSKLNKIELTEKLRLDFIF